ncbi:hypothetical protein V8E36_002014 [Tilletia maclaganii]
MSYSYIHYCNESIPQRIPLRNNTPSLIPGPEYNPRDPCIALTGLGLIKTEPDLDTASDTATAGSDDQG